MPQVFTWLGTISYSVYSVAVVVLGQITRLLSHLDDRPAPVRAAAGAAFLVLAPGSAALLQRWVELPAQTLGRWIVAARIRPIATQRAVPCTA